MERDAEFTVDGFTLRGRLHLPDGAPPEGAIVLNHGLATDSREMGGVPAALAARGWAALSFDRRGHGRSDGEHGHISRAAAIADLRAAVAWLKTQPETRDVPLGVTGHSLGASFVVLALSQSTDFRAAVLVAPVGSIRGEIGTLEFAGYRAANQVSQLKQRLGLGPLAVPYKNRAGRLFLDEEAAKRAAGMGFLHPTISLANYDELLAIDTPAWALSARQPTLVVIARHDKAVQTRSSLNVFNALAGPKELVTLECGHSAFLDCRAGELVDQIDQWFRRHFAGKESA